MRDRETPVFARDAAHRPRRTTAPPSRPGPPLRQRTAPPSAPAFPKPPPTGPDPVALGRALGIEVRLGRDLTLSDDAALALAPLLAKGPLGLARIGHTRGGPVVALCAETAVTIDRQRLETMARRAAGRLILTTRRDLRMAVARRLEKMPPARLLRLVMDQPGRSDAGRPSRALPLGTAEAEAFARWLSLPYAAALTPVPPTMFAPVVEALGERTTEIRAGGGRALAFAPGPDDLPAIAARVCARGARASRIVITDGATLRRARQESSRILRPENARWDLGIPRALTARDTLSRKQRLLAHALVAGALAVAATAPAAVPTLLQAFVACVLFILTCARAAASLAAAPMTFAPPRTKLSSAELPTYSVLIPLYMEAKSARSLVGSLRRLDYPADKLDVIVLLEQDDPATLDAFLALDLPDWMRLVVVPPEGPRTKPKALNVGLAYARGELVTILDAEDRPDPSQLRIAAETFAAGSPALACLQARLAVDHARDTFVTRMFAIEYASLFDVLLPWLAARKVLFPLGGTSNHFRRDILVRIGGWDAFNVTEDADLGVRLARFDYEMSVIASTTWEEAPLHMGAWMRQRTRWLKGWMQTWLVHMREPGRFARKRVLAKMLAFQALILGSLMAILAFPICLVLLGAHAVGLIPLLPEPAYASRAVFALNAAVFVGGFTATAALSLRAIRLRRLWLSPLALLGLPIYWLMLAVALIAAFVDLLRRPHHWAKTHHGIARRPRTPHASRGHHAQRSLTSADLTFP
ncbi:glycosyltransferase [Amorphus orientalis]|uniref:Cellulose synthase/poly-beta-1,6-N-acetylglucosamine synthase-like glycosyltransferase n=1 Tax=Amorphus orientalis TaxID=649198 RepID=A0AAE4AT09_9HYPH|nr:glycosyltransferase [Amorphus orientalis]MDQ0316811.1 cellulose synthase/poly-beta-1,6-N-acetylglucosamine synthase-like glycosyltransferase [Amorphus orientalis]